MITNQHLSRQLCFTFNSNIKKGAIEMIKINKRKETSQTAPAVSSDPECSATCLHKLS